MSTPHYLLFAEGSAEARADTAPGSTDRPINTGRWRFLLDPLTGGSPFEAMDDEPNVQGERLELLAVLRGLEALPQPSRVTLITASRYVDHGFRFGLPYWRQTQWQWELFGRWTPIRNQDLWRRVDHALQFHQVDCRTLRLDPAAAANRSPIPRPHVRRWTAQGESRSAPLSTQSEYGPARSPDPPLDGAMGHGPHGNTAPAAPESPHTLYAATAAVQNPPVEGDAWRAHDAIVGPARLPVVGTDGRAHADSGTACGHARGTASAERASVSAGFVTGLAG